MRETRLSPRLSSIGALTEGRRQVSMGLSLYGISMDCEIGGVLNELHR